MTEHGQDWTPPPLPSRPEPDVAEWCRRWLQSKASVGTRQTYWRTIDGWFAHCARERIGVWAAEPHHADSYRNTLMSRGLSPASVARHLATVSSFYRLVLRRARPCPVLSNPVADVERPRVDTASHRAGLDIHQGQKVRAAALARGPRTAALIHLLLGTGMRVSEAVWATTSGLGWTAHGDRTLSIVRKGRHPDQVVIEPPDWVVVSHYLDQRGEVDGGWLFTTTGGRRMSRQTAYRLVRQVADPLVVDGVRIGPHALRRTVATLALDAGVPAQEVQGLLRHAHLATTQRYDLSSRERGREASRRVASMWTPSSTAEVKP